MRVLVIGSGGREHALAWKLAQSPQVEQVFTAPGNPGSEQVGANVPFSIGDIEGLARYAESERIDLTVVGPEAPLVAGVVDLFESRRLRIFGPRQEAAQLEGSKSYAKEFMLSAGIPTARAGAFDDFVSAKAYVEKEGAPIVIKADGLAAGKGVTVAMDIATAISALEECFEKNAFGDAGSRVLIEEYLEGEEVSVLALCDGENFLTLAASQDHKRAYDHDEGPNTGGMGAYAPTPFYTDPVKEMTETRVLSPTLRGMASRGVLYKGVLYAGLILTRQGPKVLEFNCRMGDPETQVVLPVFEGDLAEAMLRASDGNLRGITTPSADQTAVVIVLASEGYPGDYPKGRAIEGIEEAERVAGVTVFHAGTARDGDGKLVTAGGRVLGVTGTGRGLVEARAKAYEAADQIQFAGKHWRSDIGAKALR